MQITSLLGNILANCKEPRVGEACDKVYKEPCLQIVDCNIFSCHYEIALFVETDIKTTEDVNYKEHVNYCFKNRETTLGILIETESVRNKN